MLRLIYTLFTKIILMNDMTLKSNAICLYQSISIYIDIISLDAFLSRTFSVTYSYSPPITESINDSLQTSVFSVSIPPDSISYFNPVILYFKPVIYVKWPSHSPYIAKSKNQKKTADPRFSMSRLFTIFNILHTHESPVVVEFHPSVLRYCDNKFNIFSPS